MSEYEFFFDPRWQFKRPLTYSLGFTLGINDIHLNIYDMHYHAETREVDFDNIFAQGISHEILHNIFKNVFDDFVAYCQFDNICDRKNIHFRQWFGGLPWVVRRKKEEIK